MTAAGAGADVEPAASAVHLMGAGGAGMSGLARLLLGQGRAVTGCDARDSETARLLRSLGVPVAVGHDPSHLAGVDTVVTSSAVRPANPELLAARAAGRSVLRRAEMLAEVMDGRRRLAVTGTHGKTTTTSMLVAALRGCGLDPGYAVGGTMPDGTNAALGRDPEFVAEGDESDGSFLLMAPDAAVVTNVEADHLDTYGDAEAVHAAFGRFVDTVVPGGVLVLGVDDPGAGLLAAPARERGLRVLGFGTGSGADIRLGALAARGSGLDVELAVTAADSGSWSGRLRLQVPGAHNARNAAAAVGLGVALGLPGDELAAGVATFTGTARRFQLVGEAGGVRVYDDYAHHPTEVRDGTLAAARQVAGSGQVILVFQPHLYSRTERFAHDFAAALDGADQVVVLPVYAAREDPRPGVGSALITGAMRLDPAQVVTEPDREAVAAIVASRARPGDVVVTVGAGDVTTLGPVIVDALSLSTP